MANVNLPVASLPMYDWPEVQGATDRLWRAIRDQLRAEGIEAPDRLTRPADPATTWRDPDPVSYTHLTLPTNREV